MSARIVPITMISGFIGTGKSLLVSNLKRSLGSRRMVALADDGENDIFSQIKDAVEVQGADLIVIECACHLEPFFECEALTIGEEDEPPPRGVRIDTMVTVIDASRFLTDINEERDLMEAADYCEPDDDRTVSEVLIEQVEFADVIVINKIDLIDRDLLIKTEALLGRLNPRAKLVRSSRGQIDATEIVSTGLFNLNETDDGAGWLAELNGSFDDVGQVEGVDSFTYVERRPMHPIRFNELLGDLSMRGVVRAKGSVWVASRHHEIGVWSLIGRASVLTYGGAWFAATPAREWPSDERERAEIMSDWVPPFGDRRQEIAFIGIDINEREIRERLDECLLTFKEMKDGPDSWFSIPDPLPDWHADADSSEF